MPVVCSGSRCPPAGPHRAAPTAGSATKLSQATYAERVRSQDTDPRATEWVCDDPAYRVHFWRHPAPPPDVPADEMGWHCVEHRLAGVTDVQEVLAWAGQRMQDGDQCVVYVEQTDAGSPGLVRLAGFDPTARMFRESSVSAGRPGSLPRRLSQ